MASSKAVYECRKETSFTLAKKDVHVVVVPVLTPEAKVSDYPTIRGKVNSNMLLSN